MDQISPQEKRSSGFSASNLATYGFKRGYFCYRMLILFCSSCKSMVLGFNVQRSYEFWRIAASRMVRPRLKASVLVLGMLEVREGDSRNLISSGARQKIVFLSYLSNILSTAEVSSGQLQMLIILIFFVVLVMTICEGRISPNRNPFTWNYFTPPANSQRIKNSSYSLYHILDGFASLLDSYFLKRLSNRSKVILVSYELRSFRSQLGTHSTQNISLCGLFRKNQGGGVNPYSCYWFGDTPFPIPKTHLIEQASQISQSTPY